MGLEMNFKDMKPEDKIKLISDQLDGIRFGELTVEMKYGKIYSYRYKGEQKFFHTKDELVKS